MPFRPAKPNHNYERHRSGTNMCLPARRLCKLLGGWEADKPSLVQMMEHCVSILSHCSIVMDATPTAYVS